MFSEYISKFYYNSTKTSLKGNNMNSNNMINNKIINNNKLPKFCLKSILFLSLAVAYTQCLAKVIAQVTQNTKETSTSHAYHKRFTNAHEWSQVFDDPKRDEWQKPSQVIKALDIKPGQKICDIGAGTGYFSMRIAKEYKDSQVYAVDFEPDMIKFLNELAQKDKLDNVTAVLTTRSSLQLPKSVDRVLIVDTYHHIDDRVKYLQNLKKYLNSDATVIDIDFNEKSPMGPPLEHRISQANVIEEFKSAGYKLVKTEDFLPNQYFLTFSPN